MRRTVDAERVSFDTSFIVLAAADIADTDRYFSKPRRRRDVKSVSEEHRHAAMLNSFEPIGLDLARTCSDSG
jgi:hypothetical protein